MIREYIDTGALCFWRCAVIRPFFYCWCCFFHDDGKILEERPREVVGPLPSEVFQI